jgi:hypothetical protein
MCLKTGTLHDIELRTRERWTYFPTLVAFTRSGGT